MRKYGSIVERITLLLEQQGAMTRSEICQGLNMGKASISPVMSRMHMESKLYGKRIYISGWVEEAEGARRYPRAIYSLGNLPDAKKPKRDRLAVRRRYEQGRRKRMTMNSVFNMGKPRRVWLAELQEAKS